ncbi:MAG TPA: tetratricopeptide repeat protein [Bryobacteraceae bacterium]|nr:tetratricopeptide repeat protein [Bryobacteraceae bacterium]
MDRQTRKDLKTDKFAEDVFDVFGWVSAHKTEVVRYGAALIALVLILVGVMYYNRSQAAARQEALAKALRVEDATTGATIEPTSLHFDTEAEKTKAKMQAFTELSAKYGGTQEGAIADMYLASYAVDQGNQDEALKRYKRVVDDGPKPYASLARIALSQIYVSEGKMADAEKVLRDAIANPSATVSKEQAQLALGEMLSQTNPTEAHKLLDPLRTSARGTISRAAIVASSKIAQTGSPGLPPAR